MEALLSKGRSFNLLTQGLSALNLNQIRGYNISKYVSLKSRIRKRRESDENVKWANALIKGYKELQSLDLSKPHMLHYVTLRKGLPGRPWWEKQIIAELGLEGKLHQPVILKNIPGINQMLNEVKHLVHIQPLRFPDGFPQHPKEFETITLKSNGEVTFQAYTEEQDKKVQENGEEKAAEQNTGKLGPEWTFRRDTMKKHLDRTLLLYKVNLEQFPTKYEYKRNQDGKMYRYTFNKDTRKYLL